MKNEQDDFHEPDTASLVASTLAGYPDAFGILFQRHAPGALRLCTRLLGTSTEAQDVVQDAALQAFLGLSHLREPARFAAWFQAIAANLARSALRRKREYAFQTSEPAMLTELSRSASPPTLEEHLFAREEQKAILQAIEHLPPAHCQAITGFYLQGYHYDELAKQLGIPVSTLKWRLFEGRKQLKSLLLLLEETRFFSHAGLQRKEKSKMAEDLIPLYVDSLRHLPFARHYQAILRDATGSSILSIPLSEAEFSAVDLALRIRQDADMPSIPQDLAQRLLESFGTQLQQVVIHMLAGQILYATASFKQGTRARSVDMRISEALVLAVREDRPILITRALFENSMLQDQNTERAVPLSEEELLVQGKRPQKLGRGEHLQWEEALLNRHLMQQRQRSKQRWERLWEMLLTLLEKSPESISELHQLELASVFPTLQVIWNTQPMTALRLFDQEEGSWLLLLPSLWEKIEQQWKALRSSERPDEASVKPFPLALTPQLQEQATALLIRLVSFP
ncbi:MAG TPA: bifunctional nuclease domain-containing protein, partial [Ktedonobacteraceae bacterium]|nr:bifunctional nuclease domain-containing protein [Ktedonobacteraceae bacterium]